MHTVIIIKSNYGQIFGGLTSKSWSNETGEFINDIWACLFLIKSNDIDVQSKCPLIFTLQDSWQNFAIRRVPSFGPIFGLSDIHIGDKCDQKTQLEDEVPQSVNTTSLDCYCNNTFSNINLCGGNQIKILDNKTHYFFDVAEYEVYDLIY